MALKPPVEVPQGAIRLNTDSQKLEFFAQGQWWEMATDVPTLNGGARGIFGSRMDNQPFTGNVTIDSVIIASTGNAVNWGDHHRMDSGPHDGQPLKRRTAATMSDSHGGIS